MKALSKMDLSMEEASLPERMEITMKENGAKIIFTAMGFPNRQMETVMRESGRIMLEMVKVSTSGTTRTTMREIG